MRTSAATSVYVHCSASREAQQLLVDVTEPNSPLWHCCHAFHDIGKCPSYLRVDHLTLKLGAEQTCMPHMPTRHDAGSFKAPFAL